LFNHNADALVIDFNNTHYNEDVVGVNWHYYGRVIDKGNPNIKCNYFIKHNFFKMFGKKEMTKAHFCVMYLIGNLHYINIRKLLNWEDVNQIFGLRKIEKWKLSNVVTY
jgi:hypothetical protein